MANPAAAGPLDDWYRLGKRVRWRHFPEVKGTFGQTDQTTVGSGKQVAIFDVGGNRFRLVARISYETQKLYVLRVMTHKEYDKGLWVTQL